MRTTPPNETRPRRATATLLLASLLGLAVAAPTSLPAATLSELLERGIYSEETKGDLDAAMEFYEQVVNEAKAGEATAAQAQYRIGVCHYKKQEFDQASAAFEKLVQDYPDQKNLVRLARDYLAGAVALLPAPWIDGEEMQLSIKTATGFELGFVRYTIHANTLEGRKIWRLNSRQVAGAKQASQVAVDADTFEPVHSRWKHSLLGEGKAAFSAGRAEVTATGEDNVKTTELDGVCYDNDEIAQLIRRLPLAPGYQTTLRVFTGLDGARIVPIELTVAARETVTVPAGTYECFKIEMGVVSQTFWYSADPNRYLVKFKADGISAELTGVEQRTPEEIATQAAAAFDFPLGQTGGGVPTIAAQSSQPPQNQAKLLILTAHNLGQPLNATDWCDTLKNSGVEWPNVRRDTVFAFNAAVTGRKLTDIPSDTVVFFETITHGWNQSGGAELLASKSMGVAVAFADGRALLVDPAESDKLRWKP